MPSPRFILRGDEKESPSNWLKKIAWGDTEVGQGVRWVSSSLDIGGQKNRVLRAKSLADREC